MKVTQQELDEVRKKLKSLAIDPEKATRGQIASGVYVTDRRARTLQEYLRGKVKCEEPKTFGSDKVEKQELHGNTWEITLPKTTIHTLEQLLDYCKVDLSIWEVDRFIVNKWDANAGNGEVMPLYQVKAFLKKKEAIVLIKEEIKALKEEAKKESKTYTKIGYDKLNSGYMLEISIPDLHMGKMGWSPETGDDHYDSKIAQKVFEDALEALVKRTESYKFDQILFVVGNDLLNADNKQGTTEKGTPVDTDGRYQKSFVKARKMITSAIERLRHIAPVVVKVVPGNHDALSAWHLGDSLECTFENCPGVEIDNTPNFRKYHQFGKVMLMFTHGHKGKHADYPLVMATEASKMFGETVHREAHTGHTHRLQVQELHGVKVRVSPALCSADAWHSENMYIGNARGAEAFVWHKEEGLVGSANYTVPKGK